MKEKRRKLKSTSDRFKKNSQEKKFSSQSLFFILEMFQVQEQKTINTKTVNNLQIDRKKHFNFFQKLFSQKVFFVFLACFKYPVQKLSTPNYSKHCESKEKNIHKVDSPHFFYFKKGFFNKTFLWFLSCSKFRSKKTST